jgi:hypothetical protein
MRINCSRDVVTLLGNEIHLGAVEGRIGKVRPIIPLPIISGTFPGSVGANDLSLCIDPLVERTVHRAVLKFVDARTTVLPMMILADEFCG